MKSLWCAGSVVPCVTKEMGDAFILCGPSAVLPYILIGLIKSDSTRPVSCF